MQFVRKIEGDRIDVRSKSYFVFKCNICKEEEWVPWREHFNTNLPQKCKNCGVLDDSNDKEFLIKRKHQIEQSMQDYKTKLKELELALQDVSGKLNVFTQTFESTFNERK